MVVLDQPMPQGVLGEEREKGGRGGEGGERRGRGKEKRGEVREKRKLKQEKDEPQNSTIMLTYKCVWYSP